MSKQEFNKVSEYNHYRFNTKVQLNHSAVRTPGGVVTHLITINDMGVTNYYRTYECVSGDLEKTVNLAYANACAWVDDRDHTRKSVEQITLEKMGFE